MIITRTKNGLFQVEVLAGYLREFDPSVTDDTIITTWSCSPWRSHSRPYISRMQGWVLLLSQVYICCSFPPRTPLLPADGDSLSGEEVELVRRWRCSAGILGTVSLPGLLLGAEGRFWERKTQLSCGIKESRDVPEKGTVWALGRDGKTWTWNQSP